MIPMRSPFWILPALMFTSQAMAGPYPPAAGVAGSTAILRTDPRFSAWANRVSSYQVGPNCLPQWQDTTKALGPASTDALHVTCLGDGGTITLAFPGFIKNGPGADFAIFENAITDGFLECAFVEVSRDGVNFTRFPNHSLTPSPVVSFGLIDPTNIQGLGCKYRQPYGEPYDLAEVGLDEVAYVRLVDVVGDGTALDSSGHVIYDSYPNVQSSGFDLDAVGVLNLKPWQSQTVAQMNGNDYPSAAFAHLPDGRFVLGIQGALSVQTAWTQPSKTVIGSGGVIFDPSFIAVKNATTALLGEGGGFGSGLKLHPFNPSTPAVPLGAAFPSPAVLQDYSAAYWHSPTTSREGWLIGGTNGPTGKNNVSFVSLDGTKVGAVTQELSTFSSGLAVDAQGNVFTALYELDGSPNAADAEKVLRFSAASMETAIAAVQAGSPAPLSKATGSAVFKFDSASSLAVDAQGRLWGSGFKTTQVQVYDPSTGASRRLTPDHAPIPNVSNVLYQLQTFTRNGEGYVAYLAQELYHEVDPGILTGVVHGIAPLSAITVPDTLASWQAFQFGAGNLTPATEATLWGANADPDKDGFSNLLEYAFNTPPLGSNSAPFAVSSVSNRLLLSYSRDPLHTDLRYEVEVSSSLGAGTWTSIAKSEAGSQTDVVSPSAPVITEALNGKMQLVTVRDIASQSSQAHRFMRLRITRIP